MTDFLIIPDAGQGAWFWSRVWGYMTAPVEHPPRLYQARSSRQALALNLPGHGPDAVGDTGEMRLDECVQAILQAAARRNMAAPVLVGHGWGGLLTLLAAPLLTPPPQRIALVAGMIPENGRAPLSLYPPKIRRRLSRNLNLSKLLGRDPRLPPRLIARYMCNGMAAGEIAAALGFFGPLPTRALERKVTLPRLEMPCPVSYIVLEQDLLLPRETQLRMARRIPGVELIPLDSCHQAPLHRPRELADLLLGLA